MKKLVPVFCAGALLFSLAACVGGETPTGSASGSPDPGTSAQEPAGSQSSAGSSSQQADGTAGPSPRGQSTPCTSAWMGHFRNTL